jgi:2-dehydro-3-deoxyphosphogluconate aldolase/(4S)-4-hydroxy-2-oxoglutarate aldolase
MRPDPQTNRDRTFVQLEQARVIPVFYSGDPDKLKWAAEGIYKGGGRVFEFTNRGQDSSQGFKALAQTIASDFPDMLLGAGTIKRLDCAMRFRDLGAKFIVGPTLHHQVFKWAWTQDLAYCPAGATPSEIDRIMELFEDSPYAIAKMFPGETLGVATLAAIVAANNPSVTPVRIMVTGGVRVDNIGEWFNAGAVAVGAGSITGKAENITAESVDVIAGRMSTALQGVPEKLKPTFCGKFS